MGLSVGSGSCCCDAATGVATLDPSSSASATIVYRGLDIVLKVRYEQIVKATIREEDSSRLSRRAHRQT